MKWVADPGLDGDVYADKPYLYGPALSSLNTLHVGGKEMVENTHEAGLVFEEGGCEKGLEVRNEKGVPETQAGRKKHFLNEENRKGWEWEEGTVYGCDFFNPYLDFNGRFSSHRSSTQLMCFLFQTSRFCVAVAWFHSSDYEILGWTRTSVRHVYIRSYSPSCKPPCVFASLYSLILLIPFVLSPFF